jgi:indolepyruvate ferredoxin oxidoreductase
VPVPELTRILEAEGVVRTIVCAEDPSSYPEHARWGRNVDIWPRERLDEAQRVLREVHGVTVIVYDQACAAEKRRARRRGKVESPPLHVFINERVCEGCGDCGVKSNCLSVQPVDTEFGRKTRIHQSSCNQDYTCLDGDCPSFVTVTETRRSRRRAARRRRAQTVASATAARVATTVPDLGADLPEPDPATRATVPADAVFSLYLTGVGGTGVVTVSQIVATAALLEGYQVAGLDQTGLSQKGGPVVSHVKLSRQPIDSSNAVAAGEADTYLGFDLLVAADPRHLAQVRPGTRAALSTSKVATGAMVTDVGTSFPAVDGLLAAVANRTHGTDVHLDSIALAEGLFGDHMMANLVVLGAAYQSGAVPVSAAALEQAIELNGVAVGQNRQAFRWGRRYLLDPAATLAAAGAPTVEPVPVALLPSRAGAAPDPDGVTTELERLVGRRVAELRAYQGDRPARDYAAFVDHVATEEARAVPGSTALAEAVARNLFKLTAYKDEYEVARLVIDPALDDALQAQFPDGGRVHYRLHPPVLRALGMHRKIALGRWSRPGFRVLRSMRHLRGTLLDPFGHTKVRRTERALPGEYRDLVDKALVDLSPANHDRAVQLAELPDVIRGYEQIKLANVDHYHDQVRALGF